MPVIKKSLQLGLEETLLKRFDNLLNTLRPRELTSSSEGAGGKGSWIHPERMCATTGSAMEIRLAVEDFKAILAEVKKLA